ncbi:hypothetical protein [Nocardioides jishulii]|uniref:FUSC family protein n=1 Tax=Nocardioides jishulii TaxID=2575440 RepID=A0A4U2YL44_9ACTN|nr:hypothetical protein [Nocardioides jishulii]QCX26811.1 hypothetical protein FCL41_04085 [Nocardioides jishulii]TKI61295.1 hypothetical protein FC770_10720 [Nocardioides jishulii]
MSEASAPTSAAERGGSARKRREKPEHRRSRPGGSPVLLILGLVVVVPSVMVADHFGSGPAGIIGGLVGLFSLVALMGGSLRADLRVAAVLAPLLVVAAVAPRLLAQDSRPAAIGLVVLLGFVAALLPGLGPRFANTGLGLGMTTLYAYAYATHGTADDQQVVAAAVSGVVVALLVRVLFGIADASKPTREQVAQALEAEDTEATVAAFDAWLSDGRPRWLATVLGEGSRFRVALRRAQLDAATPSAEPTMTALRARCAALADQVRAKRPPSDATPDVPVAPVPPDAPAALREASASLDTVEKAVRERDTTAVVLDRGTRRALRDAVMHPSARLRSVRMRHAVRTAFGLLVMLLVTAPLDPSDPLVVTVLMATFSILQASWRDTLAKARTKVVGVVVGAAAVAVILLAAPSSWLMPISALSLALGLWYVVTRPALGGAFMVMVSVGFNSVTRDLDATELLVQYTALTACAVVVGLVLGFVVVPAFRPAALRQRIQSATEATAEALRAAADGASPTTPEVVALHRDATQKQGELVPDHDKLDDRQLAELDRLREGLRDLTTIADTASLDRAALVGAVELLSSDGERGPFEVPASDGLTSTMWDLAEQSVAAERYLLRTLPSRS